MSIPFPKDNVEFISDKKIQRIIKSLEDRIEQRYQTLQLKQSLSAIIDIVGPKTEIKQPVPIPQDLLDCLNFLTQDAPPQDQLDMDRNAIWEMRRRIGTRCVLVFLSPKLWLGLEHFFSGIVVGYIQMFSSGGRDKLQCKQVFKGREDLKISHERIERLRNKQYSHKELEDDRHHACYSIGNEGEVIIDTNGVQRTIHYHLNEETCDNLLKCLVGVSSFLKKEIQACSRVITENLTEKQKCVLREHASRN